MELLGRSMTGVSVNSKSPTRGTHNTCLDGSSVVCDVGTVQQFDCFAVVSPQVLKVALQEERRGRLMERTEETSRPRSSHSSLRLANKINLKNDKDR